MNTMVIHGQLDDAFILEENSSQHLFFMGMDTLLFTNFYIPFDLFNIRMMDDPTPPKPSKSGTHIISTPFFYGKTGYEDKDYSYVISGDPTMMVLPLLSLGYIARYHINSKMEINFNTFISSPDPHGLLYSFPWFMVNIYGPGILIDVGFKINTKKSDIYPVSYKLNIGIDYTGDCAGAISVKNSILLGIRRELSFLSLNPFINFAFKIGTYPFNLIPLFSIVLEPGFELTSKVVTKNNFVFISSFMIGYEGNLNFSFFQFFYVGKIVVSASFGLGSIVKK